MKSFASVRIVKVGSTYLLLKENVEELWITPGDELSTLAQYDLDYKIRDILKDMEERNATK